MTTLGIVYLSSKIHLPIYERWRVTLKSSRRVKYKAWQLQLRALWQWLGSETPLSISAKRPGAMEKTKKHPSQSWWAAARPVMPTTVQVKTRGQIKRPMYQSIGAGVACCHLNLTLAKTPGGKQLIRKRSCSSMTCTRCDKLTRNFSISCRETMATLLKAKRSTQTM